MPLLPAVAYADARFSAMPYNHVGAGLSAFPKGLHTIAETDMEINFLVSLPSADADRSPPRCCSTMKVDFLLNGEAQPEPLLPSHAVTWPMLPSVPQQQPQLRHTSSTPLLDARATSEKQQPMRCLLCSAVCDDSKEFMQHFQSAHRQANSNAAQDLSLAKPIQKRPVQERKGVVIQMNRLRQPIICPCGRVFFGQFSRHICPMRHKLVR